VRPTNRPWGPGAQITETPVANCERASRNCRSVNAETRDALGLRAEAEVNALRRLKC